MSGFVYSESDISQRIVKYGVDVRPVLVRDDREKLQIYSNWLIDEYPQAFETLLSGPERTIVQKVFVAGNNKRIELPTFSTTDRGFCYTFPVCLLVQNVEDFDILDKNKIFRKSIEKFRQMFAGHRIVRVGVVNEIVFDTGSINSVEIIANEIRKDVWRERVRTVAIHLENPTEKYNVNVDLGPAYAQQVVQSPSGTIKKNIGFGITVKLDINNQDMTEDLDDDAIAAILAFADDYVPESLVRFLNNEQL
jgi:hypothetical protein